MKKSNEHSIMIDQYELQAIEQSPIAGGVIRRLRDEDGNLTRKTNVRAWEDIFFVDFPSEAARDAWLKEIAYMFVKIGFWRSNRLDYLDIQDDRQPEYTDEEFDAAKRRHDTDMAEMTLIGLPVYLAKLDREFAASFGVTG